MVLPKPRPPSGQSSPRKPVPKSARKTERKKFHKRKKSAKKPYVDKFAMNNTKQGQFGRAKTPLFQARLFEETIWANLSISNRAMQRKRFDAKKGHAKGKRDQEYLRNKRESRMANLLSVSSNQKKHLVGLHKGKHSKKKRSHTPSMSLPKPARPVSSRGKKPLSSSASHVTAGKPSHSSRASLMRQRAATTPLSRSKEPERRDEDMGAPNDFWSSYHAVLMGDDLRSATRRKHGQQESYQPQSILTPSEPFLASLPEFLEISVGCGNLLLPLGMLASGQLDVDDNKGVESDLRTCVVLKGSSPINKQFRYMARSDLVVSSQRNPIFQDHFVVAAHSHPYLQFAVYHVPTQSASEDGNDSDEGDHPLLNEAMLIGYCIVRLRDLWRQQLDGGGDQEIFVALSHQDSVMHNKLQANFTRLFLRLRQVDASYAAYKSIAVTGPHTSAPQASTTVAAPAAGVNVPIGRVRLTMAVQFGSVSNQLQRQLAEGVCVTVAAYYENHDAMSGSFEFAGQVSLDVANTGRFDDGTVTLTLDTTSPGFDTRQLCLMLYAHSTATKNLNALSPDEKILLGYSPFPSLRALCAAADEKGTLDSPLQIPAERAHSVHGPEGSLKLALTLDEPDHVKPQTFALSVEARNLILPVKPRGIFATLEASGSPFATHLSLLSRGVVECGFTDPQNAKFNNPLLFDTFADVLAEQVLKISLYTSSSTVSIAGAERVGSVTIKASQLLFLSRMGMPLQFPLMGETGKQLPYGKLVLHLRDHVQDQQEDKKEEFVQPTESLHPSAISYQRHHDTTTSKDVDYTSRESSDALDDVKEEEIKEEEEYMRPEVLKVASDPPATKATSPFQSPATLEDRHFELGFNLDDDADEVIIGENVPANVEDEAPAVTAESNVTVESKVTAESNVNDEQDTVVVTTAGDHSDSELGSAHELSSDSSKEDELAETEEEFEVVQAHPTEEIAAVSDGSDDEFEF